MLETLADADGSGVRLLVVDSGVDADHEALAGRVRRCWRVEDDGEAIVEDEGGDAFGHGTAVAAIIAEHAPGAEIESLRVLGGNLRTSSRLVLAGLRWGIEQGFDIVNCSFGTARADVAAAYKLLVDLAFCRNTWIVSSCNNLDFQVREFPGSFPSVLSTDYGPLEGLAITRRPGELVEFVARGVQVRVAWRQGGWRTVDGSSFAAPHLAALAARLREREPGWNVVQAKAALYACAR